MLRSLEYNWPAETLYGESGRVEYKPVLRVKICVYVGFRVKTEGLIWRRGSVWIRIQDGRACSFI